MKTKSILSVLLAVVLLSSCKTTEKSTSPVNNSIQNQTQVQNVEIVTMQSFVDVKTTMDRLEKMISLDKGIKLFNRINHAENSKKTGAANVLDNELIIFGNPKVGLKMLNQDQKVGLDLPLKIVAYKAKDGKVYVSYRAVSYFSNIYNLENCKAQEMMNNKLIKISNIITKSPDDFKLFMQKSKKK